MPTFAYKGVTRQGRAASGTVQADTPRSARARLREQGILASHLEEATAEHVSGLRALFSSRRVRPRELARLLRQLATLIAAEIPLVDAVGAVERRQRKPMLAATLAAVRADLTAGDSLEAAVARHPRVFPPMYRGMIRAGEEAGALDRVILRIAEHAEASARLQERLRAAMTYPLIMMIVGTGVVAFLLAYVVPEVTRVFAESRQTLPVATRALMALGEVTAAYGTQILLALAACALVLRSWAASERGARQLERILYRIPWLGTVLRNVAMARFSHTLATLVSGGVPLVTALEVSRAAAGSRLVADALGEAREAVTGGESLVSVLERSGLFPPMIVDMVAVGEKSGRLEEMLEKAAAALDEEISVHVDTAASLVEPVMILLMAGVVLFVVLAIMIPIFEMNRLVQ